MNIAQKPNSIFLSSERPPQLLPKAGPNRVHILVSISPIKKYQHVRYYLGVFICLCVVNLLLTGKTSRPPAATINSVHFASMTMRAVGEERIQFKCHILLLLFYRVILPLIILTRQRIGPTLRPSSRPGCCNYYYVTIYRHTLSVVLLSALYLFPPILARINCYSLFIPCEILVYSQCSWVTIIYQYKLKFQKN